MITPEKAEKIAEAYVSSNYNKREGLRAVYPEATARAGNMLKLVYANLLVKNEIIRVEAENKQIAKEKGIDAVEITKRFDDQYTNSVGAKDRVNALRSTENLAKRIGYFEADNASKRPQIALVNAPGGRLEQLKAEMALIEASKDADLAVDEG